jgi:type IV pilus assembly protein PilM
MYSLGIHFDQSSLKVALLHRVKKDIHIELLRTFRLDEGVSVKPLYILAPILAGKEVKISSGLEAGEVFLRDLSLKLTQRRSIYAALPFQVESLIPSAPEELILLPFFKKRERGRTDLSLIASKRAHLQRHLEAMKHFELDPDQVSCIPTALYRFARFLSPKESPLLLLHVGEERCTYTSLSPGGICYSNHLNVGARHFAEASQEEEGLGSAYPPLYALTTQFEKELLRISLFLSKKNADHSSSDLLLSGNFSPNLESFIKRSLGMPFFSLDAPLLKEYDLMTLQAYAIPIGLGVEALIQDGKGVQFRQGGYISYNQVKRQKKRVSTYLISSLLLTLVLWMGGTMLIKKRETVLHHRLEEYAGSSFEQPLRPALDEWDQTLTQERPPPSYTLSVPKVSDLLAWLSMHPKGDFELKHLRYVLTKLPKISMKREMYEAKVELEFIASSPRSAREFHDALLSGEGLVNAQREITWDVDQEHYRTSFFLKRRPV